MITDTLFPHSLLKKKDLTHGLSQSLRTTAASSCLEFLTRRIMEAVTPLPPVVQAHPQEGGCCVNKAW